MTKLIKKFIRNEDGASAAEYALILAVVGGAIATAAGLLGTNIAKVINAAATAVDGVNIVP